MTKQKFLLSFGLAVLAAFNLAAQVSLNGSPSRVLGATSSEVTTVNPNLVEGRELFQPFGVAVDTTASPAILYVADTANNRVLAWRNAVDGENAKQSDLVIGQRNFYSTFTQGPGSNLSTGLNSPTGLAVDANGNLWVADAGNNRLLRYPKPFAQKDEGKELIEPDVVVGQQDFNSRAANGGEAGPNAKGLALIASNRIFRISLTFDPNGNLWVNDPLNNRVLRFPAASLNGSFPVADLVLGQPNFESRATAGTAAARFDKKILNGPTAVTIDPEGRVFVADSLIRVLAYRPPFTNGVAATRIAGLISTEKGQPTPPTTPINQIALGVSASNTLAPPEGLAIWGDSLMVLDIAAHRIVTYAPYDEWPEEAKQFSPSMIRVTGQLNFTSGKANGGGKEPGGNTFALPSAIAVHAQGNEIYVADSGNNRVLRLGAAPNFNQPMQVFGQMGYAFGSPNFVEGREFYLFNGFTPITGVPGSYANGGGIAVDGNRLYVADTMNHRVLGYKDVRTLVTGGRADIVIGQESLYHALINAPSNDADERNDGSLLLPSAVAVDAQGNLYVADSGNGRVLRFPSPFNQPEGTRHKANLVLGQSSFTSRIIDASSRTMARPFGVAVASDGSVAVSDAFHNRVLLFKPAEGGNFTNGQAAATVFGQADFNAVGVNREDARHLTTPRGLAFDGENRLYVADAGKNRIAIFDNAPASGSFSFPAFSITTGVNTATLKNPHFVYVSPRTGEIWATNTAAQQVVRYPIYSQLILTQRSDFAIGIGLPTLGLAVDQYGALFLADAANRVGIYYPSLVFRNAANFIGTTGQGARALAPGAYGSLGAAGVTLSEATVAFSTVPMPTILADTQVLLNGQPVPLHFVSPGQINFLIPNHAPTSGTMEATVIKQSTGHILASGVIPMGPYAPGLFTSAGSGTAALAATNEDGTINSPSNAAKRGQTITLYGTGLGTVPGAPADGDVPGQAVPGSVPQIIIGAGFVPPENIQYSGLAPSLIGVWQINVKIPEATAPGDAVPLSVILGSIPNNHVGAPYNQRTTISVKQ